MANISDIIESFLLETLGDNDTLNISRNELANYFACAPSQINYVLSTRFTPDRGYLIESRRGGGGFITVVRLSQEPDELLQEVLNQSISDGVSMAKAAQIVDRFVQETLLTEREGILLKTILSDKSLVAPTVAKDGLRAGILKSVIYELLRKRG
ncbi:MAG: CtsR family transcriptional regulator [Clostridia bacterium]|jgi:transcriptional regulator CtsR|nr:CtsR family transcriptional regulator [Clostridia bacterium]